MAKKPKSVKSATDAAMIGKGMKELTEMIRDPSTPKKLRDAAMRKLDRQSKADNTKQMSRGGMGSKQKIPVISISVGTASVSKGKKGTMKMAAGGMANGKQHMYLSEGALVTDKLNPGLKALAKERPDVVRNILKK